MNQNSVDPNKIRQWTQQLYSEYDNVCYQHRIKLLRPSLIITKGRSYWGKWEPRLRRISLNQDLILSHSWDVVIEVLKHEMAHQWVHEVLQKPDAGHGIWFQEACERLAVAHWAQRPTGDLSKHPGRTKKNSLPPKEKAILRRVEKLLALSKSDNQHESLLAMQQVLKLKESFDIDEIRAKSAAHHDYVVIQHKLKVVPQHQTLIASILNSFFSVNTVFTSQYDPFQQESYKVLEILGSTQHLKIAEYVYFFLWQQLPKLWLKHKKQTLKANRKSFYLGLLTGFQEQLAQKHAPLNPLDRQQGQLICRHQQELSVYLNKRHPRLRSRSYSCKLRDEASFRDGKHQGRQLKLQEALHQNLKKLALSAPKR